MKHFDLSSFIAEHVTGRSESLFQLDVERHKAKLSERINDKAVLVIGGAGTIGSSFIKAILQFKPRKLYVIDTNENGLTELTRDLRSSIGLNIPDDYKTYPINFGDSVFEKLFHREGPFEIVANFAAHKHVRSEKDHYSIEAMIHNNVIRAKRLLDLLLQTPPERFFCVSTDKAANPVNVMGASKKLMEEVILAYARHLPITTARFANVAFSNGSLLAGFLERMLKRQPFSSPLDVKRYFVSPEESGQICMLACILGESGDIYFPKLDPEKMITFSSIGTALLQAHHYEVVQCPSEEEAREMASRMIPTSNQYPVYYFPTDTSGEKLYEEFYTKGESLDMDSFHALGVIKDSFQKPIEEIEAIFQRLQDLFQQKVIDKASIVALLSEFIPNFLHIEKGKSLDQRM